ncbi:glycosyltransferase family 2 protein [Arthrobacter antibioticus]|uniref:glycosyltransferase family 2 protein n=1 Tax=Arthrobacter sp. H35-MC1 TaxID=3046203 RepID=UPI0024B88139|nr:glycosyltransferase [Arthrobacter sp. H35-MC1]MDJ0316482.1 glycosyltransferase [Arthrobacter sp. H35-MC1]
MSLDIFIPYWGEPEYMKATIQSVLNQDTNDWHLTVVDDAYQDFTVQEYLKNLNHSQITFIRKELNEGITANFRTCVSLAQRDLLVVLGCDDLLMPNYVSTILAAHRAFPDASIIQPGVQVIDENGNRVHTLVDTIKQRLIRPRSDGRQLLSGESLASNLMLGVWLYWPSLAFRTQKIQEVDFRDAFPIIQDVALTMDMVFGGAQLLVDPTVCFRYRRHSSSASSLKLVDGSRFSGEREYFNLAADLAQRLGWTRTVRASKWRLTSRAHALALLPQAIVTRNMVATKALTRHVFGT